MTPIKNVFIRYLFVNLLCIFLHLSKKKLNISEFYRDSITFRTNIMYTPTNFDQTDHRTGPLTRYDSIGSVAGILSHNNIMAEYDNGMTAIFQQCLSNKHFMPTEVSDDTKYVKGVSSYILHIASILINGQKAVINITGIKPFFNVIVSEEMTLFMFKTKLVKILSNILRSISKFRIKTISTFPLRGYHIEKKLYIRVKIWKYFDRYNSLKVVHKVGISTVSDNLNPTYYYRKVTCEERLPLLS